jgi:RNA polymerase sigma factor (sigma-70 family)
MQYSWCSLRRVTDRAGEKSAVLGHLQVSADDAKPLSQLYELYRKELIAFVRRKFGSGPPEPEDVAQQAFTNFAALGSSAAIVNPRAFLFRTAHNIALNDCKRQHISRRLFESSPEPREVCEARDDFNPEIVLLGKEQYLLIEAVIRAMPERRRAILLLNRLEGVSYAEIARSMGVSESVVRKHAALAIRECSAVLLAANKPKRKERWG